MCFFDTNPDDVRFRNVNVKQRVFLEAIDGLLGNNDTRMLVEKRVPTSESLFRTDAYFVVDNNVIIVEIDQFSHKSYSWTTEAEREMRLETDFRALVADARVVVLRVNVDGYVSRTGQNVAGCFCKDGRRDVVSDSVEVRRRVAAVVDAVSFFVRGMDKESIASSDSSVFSLDPSRPTALFVCYT